MIQDDFGSELRGQEFGIDRHFLRARVVRQKRALPNPIEPVREEMQRAYPAGLPVVARAAI
jgi:hypothetical protein